jgi:hypothetical protein
LEPHIDALGRGAATCNGWRVATDGVGEGPCGARSPERVPRGPLLVRGGTPW